MAVRPPPHTARLDEAVEWYRERLGLSEAQIRSVLKRARQRADDAAKVANLRAADTLLKTLDKSISEGRSLESTKAELRRQLRGADVGNIDLAVRNSAQFFYNEGRIRYFMQPQVLARRPFWIFDAIFDHRTSEICRRCGRTVLPANSKWWLTHIPPLHHYCRSTVRSLTVAQALEKGIDKRGPRVPAAEGFGVWPLEKVPRLKPKWRDLHPELAKVARSR